MDNKISRFLESEWNQFKAPAMQTKCLGGAALMTSIVAAENRDHDLEAYDQALVARFAYTYFAIYAVLRVYQTIKAKLPENRIKRPLAVGSISGLTTSATYLVQKLANDPEALASAGWTAAISLSAFTYMEVKEVIRKK